MGEDIKMRSNTKNILGQRFGRLLVIKYVQKPEHLKSTGAYWLCQCDCGSEPKIICGRSLLNNYTKSCGCLQKEKAAHVGRNSREDLIGMKFNRLYVVELVVRDRNGRKKNKYIWKCKCDCGGITFASTHDLKSNYVKSCGCLVSDMMSKTNEENGYEVRNGKRSVENRILKTYKKNALIKNFDFNISDEEFFDIINKECFYCGKYDTKQNKFTKEYFYLNGVDRINSKIGYAKNNVVSCCARCNQGKNDITLEDFLFWIKDVYEHSILEKG
jgi:hypothetical protein